MFLLGFENQVNRHNMNVLSEGSRVKASDDVKLSLHLKGSINFLVPVCYECFDLFLTYVLCSVKALSSPGLTAIPLLGLWDVTKSPCHCLHLQHPSISA